jgi:hypothetical protein
MISRRALPPDARREDIPVPKLRSPLRAAAVAALAWLALIGEPAAARSQDPSKGRPPAATLAPEVSLLGTAALPPPGSAAPARRGAARRPGTGAPGRGMAAEEPGFVAYTTDPSFRLNNRSGLDLHEIYVSTPVERSWGRDRLGQDVLRSGRFTTIRLPEGQCVNDVRVVFADGQALERRGVNTCTLTDLAFP